MAKAQNLTGMKFGKLTVIERATDKKYSRPYWLCRCECGNITKPIQGGSLKSGATTSCGCLHKEKVSETMKKLNEEQWKNEDYRQTKSKQMKERVKQQWKDEDYRQKHSERMKQQWKDEDYRKMQSEKTKEQWQDEDFRKVQSEKSSEKMAKDKNPNYKGGITLISKYLRGLQIVKQWRKDTYTRENSKCQLTGKHVHGGNSDVHHLYGFNMIVLDAHTTHNIQIKEIVSDYTDEELKLLKDYVTSCHTDTTNAVLLSEEVHMLFHNLYGSGDNTLQQYIEFKERYLAGEFKEIF